MTTSPLLRSIEYQKTSDRIFDILRKLFDRKQNGSDVDSASLNNTVAVDLDNGRLIVQIKSNNRFIWGGSEVNYRFVLATQINLLRQRIGELLKEIDPEYEYQGSSELDPGLIIFLFKRNAK